MLRPESEAEVQELVAEAAGPLWIQGGGTRLTPGQGQGLSVAGLCGVSLYEPGALTLVAQAGTPVQEVEALLAAEGQRLAFEPMDHRALMGRDGIPTLGGMVAANVSGPRRIQVGACRDFLLGVRFVDGQGRVIKNGGRVMKNVTGYDLVKLMAGSHGTLGVLSEVSLKVLPGAAFGASLSLGGLSDRVAIGALSVALGSPYEVTGAAHLPSGEAMTLIRLEGSEASVRYRAGRLAGLLDRFGDVTVTYGLDQIAETWRQIRDVGPFVDRAGDVWRISVKPGDGPVIADRLRALDLIYDWGGGLIWALVPVGTDVRAKIKGVPGHATLVRGMRGALGMFMPQPPALARINAGLRAKFDPRGVFNQGLMGT